MATNDGSRAGPQLPQQFGRYHVQKRLGDGGMGSVYLVLNTDLQREEALKVPNFDAGDGAEMRERFLREARAAAGLDHPNLCQVYNVGERDGICYLTMRYLNGRPLSDYTGASQPPRKAVEIVTKLAQALAAAHAKGVTHRDLKPANVMMCPGVGPVVMDFGLAKQALQTGRKLTRMGSILGTPAYMPPEQVKGDLTKLGPASDVYSLGVILFELLTGRPLFAGTTEEEVYAAVLFTPPPAPSSLQPGLPAVLDAVCLKAMAKAPEDRYPSMMALAADLFAYLKATPPTPGNIELMITKGGTGNVFQMATVTPGLSKPATSPLGSKPPLPPHSKAPATATQRTGEAPSSIRPAAGPRKSVKPAPIIKTRVGTNDGGRLSTGALIGGVLCFLLIVGGLGGIGALVYILNQKKADSPTELTRATPVSARTTENSNAPPTPEPKPPDTKPTDTKPTDTKPPDTKPPDTKPTDTKPTDTKPPDTKPTDTKPTDTKPTDTKPTDTKPTDTKPTDTKPTTTLPVLKTDPAVLFFEDFKNVKLGERPNDWDGDSLAVQKDEDGRPCLEVDGRGTRYVTLPRQFIKGDFQLECEFRLSGVRPDVALPYDHQLHLELASRSSTPVTVAVNHLGRVQMGGEFMKADGVTPFQNMLFRLTRKGDSYKVSFKVGDDEQAAGAVAIPGKGCFEQIRLGLTGGKPALNPQAPANQFVACLYWLRITSLEANVPKPDPNLPPMPAALHEDFSKVALGSLPEGWTKTKANNLAVQGTGGAPGLELINPVQKLDSTTLPKIDLKSDFYVDVTAVIPQPVAVARPGFFAPAPPPVRPHSYVGLFFKGPKTKDLAVQVRADGAVVVQGQGTAATVLDGAKHWAVNGPNRIRVERSSKEKAYAIRLNDALAGNAPLDSGPGQFTSVELVLVLGDDNVSSPRVTSISVVPLVPEP